MYLRNGLLGGWWWTLGSRMRHVCVLACLKGACWRRTCCPVGGARGRASGRRTAKRPRPSCRIMLRATVRVACPPAGAGARRHYLGR